MGPVLESAGQQFQGRAKVVKVDIDESPEPAEQYGITAVPTLRVLNAGKAGQKTMGFQSQKQLVAMLDRAAVAPEL